MNTAGYKTKLNRNGMKVKNIHSNPKSFGMKMNKQKQSAMDSKNISQNLTSLPINVLRNKYNWQINTISIYDEIECEDVFYIKNLPIELLNTISEEEVVVVEEEEKEKEVLLNVSSYSYTPLHLNTNLFL